MASQRARRPARQPRDRSAKDVGNKRCRTTPGRSMLGSMRGKDPMLLRQVVNLRLDVVWRVNLRLEVDRQGTSRCVRLQGSSSNRLWTTTLVISHPLERGIPLGEMPRMCRHDPGPLASCLAPSGAFVSHDLVGTFVAGISGGRGEVSEAKNQNSITLRYEVSVGSFSVREKTVAKSRVSSLLMRRQGWISCRRSTRSLRPYASSRGL